MKRIALFFLSCFLVLSGCEIWVVVGGKYTAAEENYEVDLPRGWRKFNLSTDRLLITKDGISIQQIIIVRVPIDEELPHSKNRLSKGMLPQEAADVILGEIRVTPDILNLEITENAPEKVGGLPGFKLVYSYRTVDGLRMKVAYYGVLVEDWYYYLRYEGPARYYFAKDYPVFKRLKTTFAILEDV